MANPKVSTLTNIYHYVAGVPVINSQWNTNSGNYGFDYVTQTPYIEATNTPSYIGAANYSIKYDSFFAKVSPPSVGNGTIQTALIIRHDSNNYVELSLGPNNQLNAYVSNNNVITQCSSSLPTYDSINHAFWRIRNDDDLVFHFDVSPDGVTWTDLGYAPFSWDVTSVVVVFFVGFSGIELPRNYAHVSYVNIAGSNLQLSATARDTGSITGYALVSDPNALSGSANASGTVSRKTANVTTTVPEGGLTDFTRVEYSAIDPAITALVYDASASVTGTSPVTRASWKRPYILQSIPNQYRDGSYWPAAAYASINNAVINAPDTAATLMTNAQFEMGAGLNNRLSNDAAIYFDRCCYTPGTGVTSITRSKDTSLTGGFSGKIVSNSNVGILGDGTAGYWILPGSCALSAVHLRVFPVTAEALFGQVYLSTTRATTDWFASFIYYDSSFNILSNSTYQQSAILNKVVHPGAGIWQVGTVFDRPPTNAAWVAVVPVINTPVGFTGETVYVDRHSIVGGSTFFVDVPTTYTEPQTLNINIKADRINYVMNSGFNTGTTFWSQLNVGTSGTPNPATLSWDSTTGYNSVGSLKLDIVAPSGTFTGVATATLGATTSAIISGGTPPVVQGLKPGHTYTISAWIRQGPNCPDVYMDFKDANGLGVSEISTNASKVNSGNVAGNWTRVQTTYTVPPEGLRDYSFYVYTKYSDIGFAPFTFWLDSLLVEETNTYNGYFDGGYASADYQWEYGGTANACRSYYYKNYDDKFIALRNALPSVLPVGQTYQLQFARPIT